MKKLLFTITTAIISLLLPVATQAQTVRKVININRGWLFHSGESTPSITTAKAKADGWKLVNVPHDFQIEQPWVAPDASENEEIEDAAKRVKRGYRAVTVIDYIDMLIKAAKSRLLLRK